MVPGRHQQWQDRGAMRYLLSRHPVMFIALALIALGLAVITTVKTRQGDWFSFR